MLRGLAIGFGRPRLEHRRSRRELTEAVSTIAPSHSRHADADAPDPAVRGSIEVRLDAIRPDSLRRWGRMSVDQVLWLVNQFLAAAICEGTLAAQKSPMPAPLMRFFLVYMPWPRSAPTNKSAVAVGVHDLEAERARCKQLIARFVSRPVDGEWLVDPSFGAVSGTFASKLQAKHLDHHSRQFNV